MMDIELAISIAKSLSEGKEVVVDSIEDWTDFYKLCDEALWRMDRSLMPAVNKAGRKINWQERMQHEYRELKMRWEKLNELLKSDVGIEQTHSRELLRQQECHMREYMYDLLARAEVEGVEL